MDTRLDKVVVFELLLFTVVVGSFFVCCKICSHKHLLFNFLVFKFLNCSSNSGILKINFSVKVTRFGSLLQCGKYQQQIVVAS